MRPYPETMTARFYKKKRKKSLCGCLLLAVGVSILCFTTDSHDVFVTASSSADDNNNNNTNGLAISLRDGNSMPQIGLGVALTGDQTYDAVAHAIRLGYSLVDTAAEESYGNEDQVGKAVSDYHSEQPNSKRNIFVTTKLWDVDHGFAQTLRAFWKSHNDLNKLATNKKIPVDLYLIHSPFGGRLLETWDAMLWLQKHDYVTSIGVSNFGIEHLEILRRAGRPMPVVNQIEMHPLVYQQRQDLLEYCKQQKIAIQAFGSLMHGYSHFLIDPPEFLSKMVDNYKTSGIHYAVYHSDENEGNEVDDEDDDDNHKTKDITVAHILLQWAIQHGFAIIPKSSKTHRITENVRYLKLSSEETSVDTDFVLDPKDMEILDNWGDHLPYEHRNIYKQDWNWNPIDEAPLHLGFHKYWPNYEGIQIDDLERFAKDLDSVDEDEYWEEYWENGVYLDDEEEDDDDDDYEDGYVDVEFLEEL